MIFNSKEWANIRSMAQQILDGEYGFDTFNRITESEKAKHADALAAGNATRAGEIARQLLARDLVWCIVMAGREA